MKVIKISALWCSGCLVMNPIWNKILNNYSFESEEYDLDLDEDIVKKYNPPEKLPLFIVLQDDQEISRFFGEYSYDELVNKLKDVGVIDEKNN